MKIKWKYEELRECIYETDRLCRKWGLIDLLYTPAPKAQMNRKVIPVKNFSDAYTLVTEQLSRNEWQRRYYYMQQQSAMLAAQHQQELQQQMAMAAIANPFNKAHNSINCNEDCWICHPKKLQ